MDAQQPPAAALDMPGEVKRQGFFRLLDSTDREDAPPPQRTPEDAARIALLEAVARGELDIEEALRRLDGTETSNA